ncbi:hypothetical protein EYZ11_010586 [Aspergillus tanneri]|uniref:Uncharacterized protein n=1 Tax=Aspergillus tanneri TaxID=1220188 RepID=A0A4S3J4Z2_9EURO|nr:uncharacterized protein ATNIH1004_000844 [Aspergillus tanneri]KAA8651944.1 hypothetical protein ATNIH1004_000844 [Aspergillus tanneri]THC89950.1 hypothetical protein EYZ11_010586 [Aspergillus tanneri]
MQMNSAVVAIIAALAGSSVALPHAGPLHESMTPAPTNGTRFNSPKFTQWPKIVTPDEESEAKPATKHSTNNNNNQNLDPKVDRCPAICAVAAQACVVAVPDDEDFCWDTYVACSRRC